MNKYTPIIGMETHIELKTLSKMFCGCKNDPFHAPKPNIYTCPVCLGLPGALPVANKKAVEWIIKFGLALGCKINLFSKFDRKHYFYPDLPKGYQISQYDLPFCYDGKVSTSQGEVRIRRIHLEEDTGKLIHSEVDGKKVTLVDFNRSGVPLVEIVTEPDIHSASQAKEYAKKIYQMVRYLDLSQADMEKGQMRLEANISLKSQNFPLRYSFGGQAKVKSQKLPDYKVELKNINSFRFLEKAIEYEISRQSEILDKGEMPLQETRGYNASKNITFTQRQKEEAADYRYFPEPDIPPIRITQSWLEELKKSLGELPDEVFSRWQKDYSIALNIAELLVEKQDDVSWFDKLFSLAKKEKLDTSKLASFLANKKISFQVNFDQAEKIIAAFKSATQVIDISDEKLKETVEKVIKANPKVLADLKSGKQGAVNFIIGQVMKELRQRIDFERLKEIIKRNF